MSWLARTIANSLRLDDDEDDQREQIENPNNDNGGDTAKSPPKKSDSESAQPDPKSRPSSSSGLSPRGVKEDLSELTKSLSRQFWGVASFLAPPPDPLNPQPRATDRDHAEPSHEPIEKLDSDAPDGEEEEEEDLIAGIKSDFAEIRGRFRSGISKLSENKAVSEITKIASNFLQIRPEEVHDLDGVVGVTEEVVAFARNIALHPETWLDFPLPADADSDDLDLSDAQQEHALAVERLAPNLAALRMELCPGYISDDCFWKIYFVLLHPRLSKSDAELLSTPQILEARAMLAQELDKRSKEKKEPNEPARGNLPPKEDEQHLFVPSNAPLESAPLEATVVEAAPSVDVSNVEVEKQPVHGTVSQVNDKSMVKEAPFNPAAEQASSGSANRFLYETYEDDADDWLKEDNSEMVGASGSSMPTGNEEDVSFSDLEEDDGDVPTNNKKNGSGSDSSTRDSRDWVQLRQAGSEHSSARNSEAKDSNDWLNVDDIDVM